MILDQPYAHIQESIKVFASQDYPFKELVILNNTGSLYDASEHRRNAPDSVRFIDLETKVPNGTACNLAKQLASGVYQIRMLPDQWWAPNRLSKQWDAIEFSKAAASALSGELAYSLQTGYCAELTNQKGIAPGTLLFPLSMEYPAVDIGMELDVLERLSTQGQNITILRAPELVCNVRCGVGIATPYGEAHEKYRSAFDEAVKAFAA